MRDQNIEKLLSLAGNENRYQYFALCVFLFLWMNCNFLAPVLPYLEREPIVSFIDENGITQKTSLTNEICSKNYEIIERFGYSWISEFNIECDQFMIGLIGVFTFIGNTLGSVFFAFVPKFLSHKNILILSSIGFSIVIYIITLVRDIKYFYVIFIMLLFVGLFGNLLCYSSLVVSEEIVSSRRRSLFSSVINTGYAFCGIMYSFIFMYVQNWRYDFYILIGLSLLTGLIIWLFIFDSPRSYIDNKDMEKTLKILEGIAEFNGIKEQFLKDIQSEETKLLIKEILDYNIGKDVEMADLENNENEKNDTKGKDLLIKKGNKNQGEKITIFSSLKYPSLRYKFLILCALWFGTRSSNNCISLSCKALPGNYYFNIIILFIFESFAYNVSGVLINIKALGRKGTLWSQYLIITTIFLLLGFFKFSIPVELFLNFCLRFCAAAIELVYWTYTLEVYPTPVRSVNFGVNVTCGNIGSILAPMVYEYMPSWMFLSFFAFLSVFHSFLLIFLPETEGKPMVETIEELVSK